MAIFVAATVPVEKAGDVNPLLEAAKTLGDDPSDDDGDQQQATKPSVNEPPVGSYEAFMSSFGSPQRWAGR